MLFFFFFLFTVSYLFYVYAGALLILLEVITLNFKIITEKKKKISFNLRLIGFASISPGSHRADFEPERYFGPS